jgi:survival of motor neuron protein-interacting protein 1
MAHASAETRGYVEAYLASSVPEDDADDAMYASEGGHGESDPAAAAAAASASGSEDAASSSDEEANRRGFGIYQCLPVDDAEPDWASGEPASVEEYIRRVRAEARALPAVVASAIDPRIFDDRRTPGRHAALAGVPDDALRDALARAAALEPSPAWACAFLDGFAALRRRLAREEAARAPAGEEAARAPAGGGLADGARAAALGGSARGAPTVGYYSGGGGARAGGAAARRAAAALAADPPSARMPELAALRGLDAVAVAARLRAAVARAAKPGAGGAPPPPLDAGEAARLYALAARVEAPLRAETAAAFSALLRRARAQRDALPGGARDPLLPHLNVLVAVAGGYFGQDAALAAAWEEAESDEEADVDAAAGWGLDLEGAGADTLRHHL